MKKNLIKPHEWIAGLIAFVVVTLLMISFVPIFSYHSSVSPDAPPECRDYTPIPDTGISTGISVCDAYWRGTDFVIKCNFWQYIFREVKS